MECSGRDRKQQHKQQRQTARSQHQRGRPRSSTRLRIDRCLSLDVRSLPTAPPVDDIVTRVLGKDTPSPLNLIATWPDHPPMSITVCILTTRPYYGGERQWLMCPSCCRRCLTLYSASTTQQFLCRLCLGLVYYSQYLKDPKLAKIRRMLVNPPKMTASAVRQREARWLQKLNINDE